MYPLLFVIINYSLVLFVIIVCSYWLICVCSFWVGGCAVNKLRIVFNPSQVYLPASSVGLRIIAPLPPSVAIALVRSLVSLFPCPIVVESIVLVKFEITCSNSRLTHTFVG
jgi:hypothetical protein